MLCVRAGDESFTSNKLELTRVQRGPGLNDVGMVAWHMTLKTPECQQGRQVRISSKCCLSQIQSSTGAVGSRCWAGADMCWHQHVV